jgi:hypothetical protein
MNIKQQPLVELTKEALTLLQRELGTAKTIRFIRQFSVGFGNYTVERAAQPEETLDDLLATIKQQRLKEQSPQRDDAAVGTSYQERLEQIRQRYPRAYEKWTEEEDTRLRQAHQAGAKQKELVLLLQRQSGAIESRLRKLGLTT